MKQRIEGCDSFQSLVIATTHTPFDWPRTGFDTASTSPFDFAQDKFRPTQDVDLIFATIVLFILPWDKKGGYVLIVLKQPTRA